MSQSVDLYVRMPMVAIELHTVVLPLAAATAFIFRVPHFWIPYFFRYCQHKLISTHQQNFPEMFPGEIRRDVIGEVVGIFSEFSRF